jgi:hypothetical protein
MEAHPPALPLVAAHVGPSMNRRTAIRASMLPGYADCARRAAAKQWRQEIEDAGFELRELRPSVGAAVGTAVHAAAARMLQEKIDTGELGGGKDGIEIAIEAFREETEPGAEWDDTTPNVAAAEAQIERLTLAYRLGVARHINPAAVEQAWEVPAGDGFVLTGRCDVITVDGIVRDLKTGALPRPYQAQLGAYSLLARSQDPPIEVSGVAVDFIRRTPKTKPQEPPVTETYDQGVSERAAYSVIERIRRDMTEFRRRLADGDEPPEEAFLANPMSMMCRPQFCPAHGTKWCDLGRKD